MKRKKQPPWIQAELETLTIERQRVQLRLSLETARGMRLKNDRLERSLIRKEDVRQFRTARIAQIVERLNKLPQEIADGCPAELREPVTKVTHAKLLRVALELTLESLVSLAGPWSSVETMSRT